MSAELESCPFCGSADIRFMGGADDRGGVAVYCAAADCDCTMGANWDRDAMPDHAYRNEEDAAAAWNRRAPGAPQEADVLTAALQQVDEYARMNEELRAMVDAAEAAQEAAAVQAVGQWQDIATAPQSGKSILLWWRNCTEPAIGRYVDEVHGEGWMCDGDQVIPRNQKDCLYWQPLVAPPGAALAGGDGGEG